MLDLDFEKAFLTDEIKVICGVDEAGRGPLMGPVVAAACVLPEGIVIEGLNDSKKLTEKKREYLFDIICEKALYYSIVSVDEKTIDKINILESTYLAFSKSIENLSVMPDVALIDGNRAKNIPVDFETVIKGDSLSQSIAAASILAKVSRDRYIVRMDELYPQYGFKKHKGYGTKDHLDAIKKFGPCPIHRLTFKGVKEYV